MTENNGSALEKKDRRIKIGLGSIIVFVFFTVLTASLLAVVSYFVGRESVLKEKTSMIYTGQYSQQNAPAGERNSVKSPETASFPLPDAAAQNKIAAENTREIGTSYGNLKKAESSDEKASSQSPEKKRVENYFFVMNSLLSKTKTWEDPQIFAQELLKSLLSGDTKSFDAFMSNYNKTIESVNAVDAPSSCVAHRQGVIDTLKSSYEILSVIKKSVATGDTSKLMTIAAKAQELKVKAEELEKLEKEIKKQYGINSDQQ